MTNEVAHRLSKARQLITPPEKWNQGSQITKKDDGFSHCALGALNFVDVDLESKTAFLDGASNCNLQLYWGCVNALAAEVPPDIEVTYAGEVVKRLRDTVHLSTLVAGYNNMSSHETVLAWFDQAIEKAVQCKSSA